MASLFIKNNVFMNIVVFLFATGKVRQLMFTDGTELRVYDYGSQEYTDAIEHEGRIDALDYLGNTSKLLEL